MKFFELIDAVGTEKRRAAQAMLQRDSESWKWVWPTCRKISDEEYLANI